MFGVDIAPRAALAAPTEPFVIYVQSVAILVSSILSVLGAGWMIASFLAFSNLRSFRHQLILGLAISDCAMAFNFLLSSSMNVGGSWIGAPEQARFCSFNGYTTQVFVIQTDYWVLTIAVYTYFVLTDQKRWSSWLQAHSYLPWALPWILSVLWASIGLGVTGYGDIGAWCWFTSDEVRLLVNFVPRWTIVAVMFLMYARLYFLLFRAHRRLVSLDASDSGNPSGSGSRHLESNSASQPTTTARNRSGPTRRLKQLARLMLLYPLAYAIVWSLPTGIRIYQTISGQPAPWQLATVDKACIVLQGFVDAVIYGATESSLSSWRGLLFPNTNKRFSNTATSSAVYGDAGLKRSSRRWDLAGSAGQQEELVSSTRSRPSTRMGPSRSDETLGVHRSGLTPGESSDEIELGVFEKSGSESGIRKTVEIEVVNSVRTNGGAGLGQASLQRPGRSYFPERNSRGTFLDV